VSTLTTEPGLGVIVKTVARWLKGLVLLYGIYLVAYGHVSPGGGFAGGVVIACGFVLLTLAGGGRVGLEHFPRRAAERLDAAGALAFLAIAWAGIATLDGAFFRNFIATAEQWRYTLASGGIIPLANLGLGIKVASSIVLVVTVLAALRLVTRRPRDGEDDPR
jgi:multicomponent Na+:H+ antiporter subunit B